MKTINQILSAISHVLSNLFDSEMDVMSREAREILSHKEDREKFLKAVDRLKERKSKEETFTLHTGEAITILI